MRIVAAGEDVVDTGEGYGIPRYVPSGTISSFHAGTPVDTGSVNDFTVLNLPPGNLNPFDPVLGISDFGPYPVDMTRRNAFRGPGWWNFDLNAAVAHSPSRDNEHSPN